MGMMGRRLDMLYWAIPIQLIGFRQKPRARCPEDPRDPFLAAGNNREAGANAYARRDLKAYRGHDKVVTMFRHKASESLQ
jgi:hypothetical protein